MFNFQAFVSTFILVGLFLMACRSHRWWPIKATALLVTLALIALMVAHSVYPFVGA